MKNWFIGCFLPMWAKETVLADNRRLAKKICELEQENAKLKAYVRGMQVGVRISRSIRKEMSRNGDL